MPHITPLRHCLFSALLHRSSSSSSSSSALRIDHLNAPNLHHAALVDAVRSALLVSPSFIFPPDIPSPPLPEPPPVSVSRPVTAPTQPLPPLPHSHQQQQQQQQQPNRTAVADAFDAARVLPLSAVAVYDALAPSTSSTTTPTTTLPLSAPPPRAATLRFRSALPRVPSLSPAVSRVQSSASSSDLPRNSSLSPSPRPSSSPLPRARTTYLPRTSSANPPSTTTTTTTTTTTAPAPTSAHHIQRAVLAAAVHVFAITQKDGSRQYVYVRPLTTQYALILAVVGGYSAVYVSALERAAARYVHLHARMEAHYAATTSTPPVCTTPMAVELCNALVETLRKASREQQLEIEQEQQQTRQHPQLHTDTLPRRVESSPVPTPHDIAPHVVAPRVQARLVSICSSDNHNNHTSHSLHSSSSSSNNTTTTTTSNNNNINNDDEEEDDDDDTTADNFSTASQIGTYHHHTTASTTPRSATPRSSAGLSTTSRRALSDADRIAVDSQRQRRHHTAPYSRWHYYPNSFRVRRRKPYRLLNHLAATHDHSQTASQQQQQPQQPQQQQQQQQQTVRESRFPWPKYRPQTIAHLPSMQQEQESIASKASAFFSTPTQPSALDASSLRLRMLQLADASELLRHFSARALISIIVAMLEERHVVLVGPSSPVVSRAVVALDGLLHPFKWPHLISPIVLEHQLFLLGAPFPFLVGMLERDLGKTAEVPFDELEDVVVFANMGTGKIMKPSKTPLDLYRRVPRKMRTKLERRLTRVKSACTRQMTRAKSMTFTPQQQQVFNTANAFFEQENSPLDDSGDTLPGSSSLSSSTAISPYEMQVSTPRSEQPSPLPQQPPTASGQADTSSFLQPSIEQPRLALPSTPSTSRTALTWFSRSSFKPAADDPAPQNVWLEEPTVVQLDRALRKFFAELFHGSPHVVRTTAAAPGDSTDSGTPNISATDTSLTTDPEASLTGTDDKPATTEPVPLTTKLSATTLLASRKEEERRQLLNSFCQTQMFMQWRDADEKPDVTFGIAAYQQQQPPQQQSQEPPQAQQPVIAPAPSAEVSGPVQEPLTPTALPDSVRQSSWKRATAPENWLPTRRRTAPVPVTTTEPPSNVEDESGQRHARMRFRVMSDVEDVVLSGLDDDDAPANGVEILPTAAMLNARRARLKSRRRVRARRTGSLELDHHPDLVALANASKVVFSDIEPDTPFGSYSRESSNTQLKDMSDVRYTAMGSSGDREFELDNVQGGKRPWLSLKLPSSPWTFGKDLGRFSGKEDAQQELDGAERVSNEDIFGDDVGVEQGEGNELKGNKSHNREMQLDDEWNGWGRRRPWSRWRRHRFSARA